MEIHLQSVFACSYRLGKECHIHTDTEVSQLIQMSGLRIKMM